ncbi:hypothetical protein EYZ11_010779 [Aspergillus tanneri]|uniref:Uncharacterized protein n=1 Tax=Aspergillus tanneri TaxID=1220188 RepID=A0A4S3J6K9_9EURO|nr:uncharacterized protein ATNIH1004_010401 [Aspergillus tanneri]KAA8643632.1 hypothetical protein ATNIH1004_010401 [Aspergillus tanneri]THC89758.1 hypothetical protein EYZ11_010779 [Aspergillus tanneri]
MVNWKNPESTDRLIAALIAAHPAVKLEYQAMATYFGQGATYDSIEGRFRRYRKLAEDLRTEARNRGITDIPRSARSGASTPRTPRGPRGVTKVSSASSGRGKDAGRTALSSPTRRGSGRRSANGGGMSIMDAIFLDDETPEEDTKIKTEAAQILSGIGGVVATGHIPDLEIISESTVTASASTTTTEPVTPKVEDSNPSTNNFSSTYGTIKHEDQANSFMGDSTGVASSIGSNGCGATLDHVAMEDDPFSISGMYFPHGHAGYDMDDIYGGAA